MQDDQKYDEQQEQQDVLDLDEVMHSFGISEWNNLGPAETSRSESLSLLVEINGERYCLRERPEGLAEEDLNHRYDFQRYLQKCGIPIPDLLLTPQGEPFVALGEDFFELQQWAGGEFFSTASPRSLEWVASAGSMLGRIHRASAHYRGHEHRWPSEVHIGSLVQSYLNLAHAKAEQSEIQAIATALTDWAEAWEAVLPSAMMSIGSGGHGLPEFHIHGDYHALNLRFDALGVTAVMGLEASRWEKRIFEVANGLFYFSALFWQAGSGETRPLVKRGFDPERARRFLQAYAEVYPPVHDEAKLLTDALILVSPIAIINGPLEDLFYMHTTPHEVLIEDMMERITWASSLATWLGKVRHSFTDMWVKK